MKTKQGATGLPQSGSLGFFAVARIDLDQGFTRIKMVAVFAVVAIRAIWVSIALPAADKIVNFVVRAVTL